jgi:hypothetical protein
MASGVYTMPEYLRYKIFYHQYCLNKFQSNFDDADFALGTWGGGAPLGGDEMRFLTLIRMAKDELDLVVVED